MVLPSCNYAVRIQLRIAKIHNSYRKFQTTATNAVSIEAGGKANQNVSSARGRDERKNTRPLISGKYGNFSKPSTEAYRERRRGKIEKTDRILPVSGSSAAYDSATSRHRRTVDFDRSRGKAQQERKFVNPSEFRLPINKREEFSSRGTRGTPYYTAPVERERVTRDQPNYDNVDLAEDEDKSSMMDQQSDNRDAATVEEEAKAPRKSRSLLIVTMATLVTAGAAVASYLVEVQ
eukprot:CAMPEP_0194210748 /NCGR_PEP_ID=MMETSP0156-20130528/9085_1 /TAXON_ID=33649 /ORGANISM="Thalassionema nitzschioides, Strain L26-B" /LENGTH=233 /DNA_ID=CAMNT_0038938131 /DNA_START=21 /DNA_END=722 /DNA_ORIENTATION=-